MLPRVEALATPALLVWARETAGFTPEEAAARLKVPQGGLLAWERGENRPTVPQLRKLSQLYKRPLAIFYLPKPPALDQPIQDFRRIHGEPARRRSPELLLAIRRCRERRDTALDLFVELESEPAPLELAARPSDDPEGVAAGIRNLLTVTLDEQRNWQTSYDAFHRWRGAIEEVGALVFQTTEVEVAEVRGFSIDERPLPIVAVNIKDSVYGRIFTKLHELTHLLVKKSGICDVDEETETEQEALEVFCNHVAGATLVPRNALLSLPGVAGTRGPRPWPDDVLRGLSRTFQASRETVLRRLLLLSLTTAEHYRHKRRQFAAEYAKRAANQPSGFAPHHRVAVSSAGPLFTRLVLEAFNRERITASDVADYLSIRVKHLPEIERDLLQRPA